MRDYLDLLGRLHPLHRTLVSDDTDRAVEMIVEFLRGRLGLPDDQVVVHSFASGEELSTWIVPQKYTLRDFGLRQRGPSERVLVDPRDTSLAVADYSQPVDREMGWDELEPHLFYSERCPEAIPFVFKFFYRPNYGFCLPKTRFDAIDRRQRFHARIDSTFTPGHLRCLEVVLPGRSDDSILVMSNICHPHQVNDSITGAINALMLIEHFLKRPTRHTLRFGFWPETIGAMAYFSRYRARPNLFRWALFTEMIGTPGPHALQLSRQETTLLDRIADYVLRRRVGDAYHSGRYTTVLRNDERISNGINLDIPSISLSRYPYREYHTSLDTPAIIRPELLSESHVLTREMIEILDRDRRLAPCEHVFGQPFLTRYGLFYDPPLAGGDPHKNLNKVMEDVFSYSDGRTSLFEIARRFDYDWDDVERLGQGLVDKGLFVERE
jgi:aminopeptidase-like protein